MQPKKFRIWLPVTLSLIMVAGMYLGYKMRDNMPSRTGFFLLNRKSPVQEVMELINKKYVDPVGVDTLGDEAIEAVLDNLDPHSSFIPAKFLQDINDDLAGRFEGIGIEFNIIDDTVNVVNVIRDGPSEKAGLEAGDKFLKVEGKPITGKNIKNEDVRKQLKGERGSKVNVTILRGKQQIEFTITRDVIPLYSLDASYMIRPDAGYIRINKFSETTYEEFMEALEKLTRDGKMKNLVLDLRNNGGGILDEAVQMADEFLDNNKLIVYTEGKSSPRKEYRAQRPGLFENGKLVLLVDENSASASEVVAGALQDWDRAIIVGRRTFGKGLVQEQYNLSDGSALRLTVARYFTPLGRSIQKPYEEGEEKYNEEILERIHNGNLVKEDTVNHKNGKVYNTPKGKKVYGGGGITPDYFVGIDTTLYSNLIDSLYAKNILNRYVYQFYLEHKVEFSKYTSADAFAKAYTVPDAIVTDLLQYARRDSVNFTGISQREKEWIKGRIKILLARQLWRTEGFFRISNSEDPAIKKAMEVLVN